MMGKELQMRLNGLKALVLTLSVIFGVMENRFNMKQAFNENIMRTIP